VGTINVNGKFEPLQAVLTSVSFNLCAKEEHVLEIERYIHTVKDRMQSGYNFLPFECISWIMVICLAANAVFWLNAFPHPDGVSGTLSPWYLLTGQALDYKKMSTLSLVPTSRLMRSTQMAWRPEPSVRSALDRQARNEQGGYYFMSLSMGRRFLQNRWMELPMPNDAIAHVGELGHQQGMPKTLTFADQHGHEIHDDADDVDHDHDSTYDLAHDGDSVSTNSSASSDSNDDDGDDDDDDDNDNDNDDDNDSQPQQALTAGVNDDEDDNDNEDSYDDSKGKTMDI
jgi:hypothetical protein